VLFPILYSLFGRLTLSQTSPEVVCLPQGKVINVAEGSDVVLECSIKVSDQEEPQFVWQYSSGSSGRDLIDGVESTENIVNDGEFKNVTSAFTMHTKTRSPTFLTEVDVWVTVSIKEKESEGETFKLIFGSNTNLILIVVGGVVGGLVLVSIVAWSAILVIRRRRRPRTGDGIGGNHYSQDANDDGWQDVDLRADDLRTQEILTRRRRESFTVHLDVGVDNAGYEDVIDNRTSMANENFSNRPISKYISQISSEPKVVDPEFVDADRLPSVGRALVAVGGGADLGAGQVHVRDHEELEVIQKDLGSGYTAIRKISTGEYGFLPTSSLIF